MIRTETRTSLVDSKNCSQLENTDKPFILVLQKGENLFEGILRCAEAIKLKSASISGLGALDDVTVAYYDLNKKEYLTRVFKGMYELISLNGNISLVDGKPFLHIHAALGTEEYQVIGGHIMDATVGPAAEISIIPFDHAMHRKYDDAIGLKLLCPMISQ